MIKTAFSLVIIVLTLVLSSRPALAYFSTFDTGDTLGANQYQLGLEPQIIVTRHTGVNAIAHFDMGVTESSNFRFVVGSGVVPFQAGTFYKWIPIPDYGNQPAIGFFGGVLYGYSDNVSALSFRLHPLISKKFETDGAGQFTPYTSIPFGVTMGSGTTTYPVQFEVGTKWLPSTMKHTNFWLEMGFEMNAAFSYISTGVSVPFESFENFKLD